VTHPDDSMETTEGTGGASVDVHEEPYANDRYPYLRALCSSALRQTPLIGHIALYTAGFCDFTVDVLDDQVSADTRESYKNAGSHITAHMRTFDESLAELSTGEMMRMVLESGEVVVFCGRIRRNQHLVGMVLPAEGATPEMVDDADRDFFRLVTLIRKQFDLPDEDPGGFHDPGRPSESPPGRAYLRYVGALDKRTEQAATICADMLAPDMLHYVAYHRRWRPVFSVDVLDDPDLDNFRDVDPDLRRDLYEARGRRLRQDTARLAHALRAVTDRDFSRIVFDVQMGALYFHWLRPGDFVVGVTLWQNRVSDAEWRLREVIDAVRPLLVPTGVRGVGAGS
jgi:hypothetical protein